MGEITYWQIGEALEQAAQCIKNMPGVFLDNPTDDVAQKYEKMLSTVSEAQEYSQSCIRKLKELDERHLDEIERTCADINTRNEKLKRCMQDVSYSDISRVKDLAEALEKLRRINPSDLKILIEIFSRPQNG